MLTLFGYSLVALGLVFSLGRHLSCRTRLALSLAILILLNAPALVVTLFQT